jgi:hypothetical protein
VNQKTQKSKKESKFVLLIYVVRSMFLTKVIDNAHIFSFDLEAVAQTKKLSPEHLLSVLSNTLLKLNSSAKCGLSYLY